MDIAPYDALLLVSFGGPEQSDDVVPFLENVTRGRDIPRERLLEVGEHYFEFGGRSPINDQCRALLAAIRADLAERGINVAIYWGNRNWTPYLEDTMRQMAEDGIQRALCFITAAYSSYSGCRQYRENLADAVAAVGDTAPAIDRMRHYFNHPGFVEPFVDATVEGLSELDQHRDVRVVFVTHSIPTAMNDASGGCDGRPIGGAYLRQHLDVAATIAAQVEQRTGHRIGTDLAYCSRSGPPHVPWLEPDINDRLKTLDAEGADAVVVVPIGFVSDHMEVVYDLDTEAEETARTLGLSYHRAATPGVDPRFVSMVADLALERAAVEQSSNPQEVPRATVGDYRAALDVCPAGCCANPREDRPAIGEASA